MENDLKIIQNIIQNEYNNNNDIHFGDIGISKDHNNLYFYLGKQENAIAFYKADIVLGLIVEKMHDKHIDYLAYSIGYVDLANDLYEPIYKLYKEYIKERDYYI